MLLWICLVLLGEICQVPAVGKNSSMTQDSGIITANVGQKVTLKCNCEDESVIFLYWYQQILGGKPVIISTRMRNSDATISPGYEERFGVFENHNGGNNDLTIKDLRLLDSASYYCGVLVFNAIEFGKGAFLHVKASKSNINAVVHQLALEPLREGDSVNLSCSVYATVCEGEQSLYWFRHGAAQPAIVYPSAGQCEHILKGGYGMRNCTLKLALKSVSSPDAGMYYCALASCGEIVFGNGTRVEILRDSTNQRFLLVYCFSLALAVSIIVILALAYIMYKLKTKSCTVCKGTVSHQACSASDTLSQDADILHYAALSLNRSRERPHHEDNVESVCVYSRVKSRKV
ncbi:uncharacterized protein LOC117559451 [Gymnodraco acuticeps]|uniref:Uncharacterized protein LOC117559451 n=1 Tax=Gymnodraco acuticeps TaxID=8218 RepID=A0A6P8VN89_GYMAC|nr:uncharacterized protein LOC117559451 [Gymnodraco acuticeps]